MIASITQFGVYRITNTQDSAHTTYIGSTGQSFQERWREHKRQLNRNEHHNRHLQYAWQKYGANAFEWAIVEILITDETLLAREQYWMNYYAQQSPLYNIALDAAAPMKGRTHNPENLASKPYPALYNVLTKATIPAGYNLARKCAELSLPISGMWWIASGWQRSCKGWVRQSEYEQNPAYWEYWVRHGHCAKNKTYPALRHQGTGVIIPSGFGISEMCRNYGLDARKIVKVISGDIHSYRGWILATGEREDLRAKGKPYPSLENIHTGEVVPAGFNLTAFCREHELDVSSMAKVLKGRYAHHKGWRACP